MIRILSSFAIITAAAAVIAGGTYSFFTDQETKNNNTFSAGTVKIDIANGEEEGSLPFDVDNMAPGDSEALLLTVSNVGSLPVVVNGDATGYWTFNQEDKYVTVTKIRYKNDSGSWVNASGLDSLPEIAAEDDLELEITVTLDIEATNEYQGKTYKASFVVDAVQADNFTAINSGELPGSF